MIYGNIEVIPKNLQMRKDHGKSSTFFANQVVSKMISRSTMKVNDDGSQHNWYIQLSQLVKPAIRAMKYNDGQVSRKESVQDKQDLAL